MFKKLLLYVLILITTLFSFVPSISYVSPLVCETASIPFYKKLMELFLPGKNKETTIEPTGKYVYISGYPIGFSIDGAGAVVVERSAVITSDGYKMVAEEAGIEIGDVIKKVDGQAVTSGNTIVEIINNRENVNLPVKLQINRGGKEVVIEVLPEFDVYAGGYRLGLWVRDNAVGVGMITYIDDNGNYGALGHPITDIDTGSIIEISSGRAYKCSIIGAKKGEKGEPGELRGLFLKSSNTIGCVNENNNYGVFGQIDKENLGMYTSQRVEVARNEEVQMGRATLVSTIDGITPNEYEIEIVKTNYTNSSGDKCMVIRIVDENLLMATGGIVQGMSGSPIIQNGKLVGMVTHVFVNDPKKGFANYISSMVDIGS